MGSVLGAVQHRRHLLYGGRSNTKFCNLEQNVASATRKLNFTKAPKWRDSLPLGKLLKEFLSWAWERSCYYSQKAGYWGRVYFRQETGEQNQWSRKVLFGQSTGRPNIWMENLAQLGRGREDWIVCVCWGGRGVVGRRHKRCGHSRSWNVVLKG